MWRGFAVTALFTCAVLAEAAVAQSTGTIVGHVEEVGQNPLGFGEILVLGTTITCVVRGTVLGCMARDGGRFRIDEVPPGTYALKANFVGHRPDQVDGVVVEPGRITHVELRLGRDEVGRPELVLLHPSSSREARSEKLVRRFVDAWGHAPFDSLATLLAPGFRTSCQDLGEGGVDFLREQHATLRRTFPSFVMEVRGLNVDGERVIVRWEAIGRCVDGERRARGTSVYRLRDERIITRWDLLESLDLYRRAALLRDNC